MDLNSYSLELLFEDNDTALYRARHSSLSSDVLVLLGADGRPHVDGLFSREFDLAQLLEQKWAVLPIAMTNFRGKPALVYEDHGESRLVDLIGHPMELFKFLDLSIGVAEALGYLYRHGLTHNDIRPLNVAIGEEGQVRLAGFGRAASVTRQLPSEHHAVPVNEEHYGYMSPEQSGRTGWPIDIRSDLYAAGIMFFEMLTGVLPSDSDELSGWINFHMAVSTAPPSVRLPGLPVAIDLIILRLIAKSPDERYQTPAGLVRDLRRFRAELERGIANTTFPVGLQDGHDQISFPTKLYGREAEIAALHHALDRVKDTGSSELVLISGYAGVGKSSVISKLHTFLSFSSAVVASGKFDQFRADVPYSTITQAFSGVITRLLGLSDAELLSWRARLITALGDQGQLMVNLIPKLELIIGEQQPVSHIEAFDHQGRFQRLFNRFIAVFARDNHPLVLILDDLQWIDAATLDLLEALLTNRELRHVLVVGAYRDNEVGRDHPLWATLLRMRSSSVRRQEISLASLTLPSLGSVVADALSQTPAEVEGLAELVYEKTEGNPFYAIQFLVALVERGFLTFDMDAARWSWNLSAIRQQSVTDNVATMIKDRLRRFPKTTRALLVDLACLGSSADVSHLAFASDRTPEECHNALLEALSVGVVSKHENTYSFSHDRLQEAAYMLQSVEELDRTHLRIGRKLWELHDKVDLEENAFKIADQYNRSSKLIVSPSEKERVAYLNLVAARRAKDSTAYQSALAYASAGRGLLEQENWGDKYELMFALSMIEAECELLSGHLSNAKLLLKTVNQNCKTSGDKAIACCLESDLYVIQSDNKRGIEVALNCLTLFGINLSADPSREDFDAAYAEIWDLLDGRPVSSLVDLPPASDAEVIGAQRVLQALFTPAGHCNPNLLNVVLCKMVVLTLKHGATATSPIGLGWLGVMVGHVLGRYDDGLEFGRVAYAMVERHGYHAEKAKILMCLEMVQTWTRPLGEAIETVRRAFEHSRLSGDALTACFCAVHIVTDLLFRGDNLNALETEIDGLLAYSEKAKFRDCIDYIRVQRQFVRTMRGGTPSFPEFDSETFDSTRFEAELAPGRIPMMTFYYWIAKGAARYVAEDFEGALESLDQAGLYTSASNGHLLRLDYEFYSALTLAALDRQDHGYRRDRIAEHLFHLERWAERCPSTFADKACLIGAELARLDGRHLDAMDLYDKAIVLATKNGAIQYEAISAEVAARFYDKRGNTVIAKALRRRARDCYRIWGADAKVRSLDLRYAGLARPERSSTETAFERLDRATIVKISQAISSEIDLNKLVEVLMALALENSAGERAVLVLPREECLRIEAEGRATAAGAEVCFPRKIVSSSDLPESVVRYAMRSRECVLIGDALLANPHAGDPYFLTAPCRSLVCVPLLRYQQAVGALFIENNRLPGVFTPERMDVLQLISLQAGISLENAALYSDVQQITNELRVSYDMIPAQAWKAQPDGLSPVFNKQWHDYTGVSPEVAIQGGWIDTYHPEDREKVLRKWAELVATGTEGQIEARIIRHDGVARAFLVKGTPMRDHTGAIIKWFGTHTDIDDLKRVEEAQELLARAGRLTALGELTASIAHEVNQPLMAIVTNAATCLRWLSDDQLDVREAREAAERIVRDGHRAGEVITSIRALARKSPMAMAPVDVNVMIEDVLALTRGELQRHGIELDTRLASDVEATVGDRIQLQQVVLNLILNAMEALTLSGCDKKKITVVSRRCGRIIIIAVKDTGPGVEPSKSNEIFDAFFTTKAEGLGIGLSICRSIVEAHGGRIWATLNEPVGTVFSFTLPASSDFAMSGGVDVSI